MEQNIKPPAYTRIILLEKKTDQNVYHIAEGTNGKFRVNKLWELEECLRKGFTNLWVDPSVKEGFEGAFGGYTHVWITLSVKDSYKKAKAFLDSLPE